MYIGLFCHVNRSLLPFHRSLWPYTQVSVGTWTYLSDGAERQHQRDCCGVRGRGSACVLAHQCWQREREREGGREAGGERQGGRQRGRGRESARARERKRVCGGGERERGRERDRGSERERDRGSERERERERDRERDRERESCFRRQCALHCMV